MTTFTIDSDQNIIAYSTPEAAQDAQALGARAFTNQKELAKLSADWPISRLVETWNSFAGVAPFDELKPVKKFTDRKTAVTRIWQAIQKLATGADGGAQGAPEVATASKEATGKKNAPKAKKGAKAAKSKPEARQGSKKAAVLALLRRDKGATNAEIQQATDWQNHSIRGFISGQLTKKMGLTVESAKNDAGERVYRIVAN